MPSGFAGTVPVRFSQQRAPCGLRKRLLYVSHTLFCRIMIYMSALPWLARVRHDLVKRLVWPARDRRDAGGVPAPGELVATLIDEEGRRTTAAALWAELAAEAPAGLPLGDFEAALFGAVAAAEAGDLPGVLALEPAFDVLASLARSLEGNG
jgi:hypothetical protein